MGKYTPRQVEDAVEASTDEDGWHVCEDWQDYRENGHDDERLVLDIDGQREYAEYVGGKPAEENGGSKIWAIIKVGEGPDAQYFKKYGCHISHDGTYWDGSLVEVKPAQKTVTVYDNL